MMNVIHKGRPLPLASIDNRRSLIYRANLVDAIVTCIVNPAAAGHTYLVSDGRDVSTPELLRMLADALGVAPKLFPFPELLLFIGGKLCGKGQAVDRLLGSLVVDISKIKQDLGWQPPYSMEEGIKKTADWYLNEKNK
jgi:nucleoside-diphosphate-sugar epimerase